MPDERALLRAQAGRRLVRLHDAVSGEDRTFGWRGLHDAPADVQHRGECVSGASCGAKRHGKRRGGLVRHDVSLNLLPVEGISMITAPGS
jgi:hypothetical protein